MVKYAVKGEERSSVVKLIDYADADKIKTAHVKTIQYQLLYLQPLQIVKR